MVKLQKRFAYRYQGKNGERVHYKHILTIPDDVLDRLGWNSGEEIEFEVKNSKLVLHAKDEQQ